MSIEIQAAFPCPHLIMEEPVQLGSDRQSLVTKAPVSGAGSVRLLVNNSIYVPPSGLHSQATLTAGVSGPYRIERCVGTAGPDGNLFTVTTSTGSATVRLPEGSQVTLSQVQKSLRLSEVNNLVSILGRNGALSLVDSNDAGTESFVRVSGKGSTSLGFQQKGARGSEIFPSWGLSSRSDVYPSSAIPGVQYVRARYPKFTRPISGNPDIKVTYASMPERCPRCGATYVENDWRFDPVGDVITIANEDLLVQACLKAILTIQGSNPFHPRYGSALNTRIGQKAFGPTASLIQEDVAQALSRVQALQRGQRKYQNVSDKELLYSIQSVDVRPSPEDPTIFFVNVTVRNGSAEPISLSIVFTVPGTIALAGSNGQTLGLERAGITPSQSARFLLE